MAKGSIPIYHDDDFERLSELRTEVAIAERRVDVARANAEETKGSPARVGDDGADGVQDARDALHAAQQAFNDFVDVAIERAEIWSIKPIGHEEFRELLKAHPPRKVTTKVKTETGEEEQEVTHPEDAQWELNTETFPKALVLFVDPDDDEIRTVVEPKFDTEAAFRKRVKRLSQGEFDTIWATAFSANEGGVRNLKAVKF